MRVLQFAFALLFQIALYYTTGYTPVNWQWWVITMPIIVFASIPKGK